MLKKFFTPVTTAGGYFIVGFDTTLFKDSEKFKKFSGSYHIIGSRLLGLSYPDFLLYTMKQYKARLTGRKGYCYPAFERREDCWKLCTDLEKSLRSVIKECDLEIVE